MNLSDIVELIENHGFAVVIVILIFFASFKFFEKFFDWFLALIKRAFDKSWNGDGKENHNAALVSRKRFFASMRRLECVDDMLDQLRQVTGADRIAVFQYHNGGTTVAGIPYLRCSMTNEVLGRGNQPNMPMLQGLPVAMFGRWNRMVANHSTIHLPNIHDLQETDPTTWEILTDQRVKSIYVSGLYDSYGLPLGFLTVEACLKPKTLDPKQISEINDMTNRISGILSVLTVEESDAFCEKEKQRKE